jgi:cystathionine gamma-synthase
MSFAVVDGMRAMELGSPGVMRAELNSLVLAGRKTATAGLVEEYEAEQEPPEQVGERLALVDDAGERVGVIVVDRTERRRIADVDWAFAEAEGEGFTSLEHWHEAHRAFWASEGVEVRDDTEAVLIWFHLERGLDTLAIHAGQQPDPATGAVNVPIYATSTYAQDGVGSLRAGLGSGYDYSRSGNPTRTALQVCLAALEGAAHAFAFASGMAAQDTLLRALLEPGDHVVIPDDAYGGTYRLFARVLARWGVRVTPVPLDDLCAVEAALEARTRLVWAETPTNPLLTVADIAGLADVAHRGGARLVVDNTFATPALQRPLQLGADVVLHSTTKYLGGHSDVVGGAVVVDDADLAETLAFHQNAMGAVPGPFDAFLTLRGIKTLGVRMARHCDNAEAVVAMLGEHPRVEQVLFPGLPGHRGHEVAGRQMSRFGAMVSFRVTGGASAAASVCARTRVFTLAESLGGVESLIELPGQMTHASVAGSPLEVPADLVRLSVGIESVQDLIDDLRWALRE